RVRDANRIRRQILLRAPFAPWRRVVAQIQTSGRVLQQCTRHARLPRRVALRGDGIEGRSTERVHVPDDPARERLHIDQRLLGEQLVDPFAARALQTGAYVRDRLLERETGKALMHERRGPAFLEMGDEVRDELLVTRDQHAVEQRLVPKTQPAQGFYLPYDRQRKPLERIDDDH